MLRFGTTTLLVSAILGLSGAASTALGQTDQYTHVNLGTPPNADTTTAIRMNNLGQVVGYSIYYGQGEPSIRPWVWTPQDGFTVLPPPPDMFEGRARAMDISDTGIIAGDGGFDSGIAWRYENGQYETFGAVGGMSSAYLGAVNDAGDVVGTAKDSQLTTEDEIFLDINGSGTLNLTPGDEGGRGVDINNSGQICGYSQGGGFGAFIWDEANGFEFLGAAGLAYSFANDMNDLGQVVGYAQSASGNTYNSWIYTPGSGQQVLPNRGAAAVNNDGVVVGTITCCGPDEPWIWTPQGGAVMLFDLFNYVAVGLSGPSSRDINDAGQILLNTYDNNANGYRPVVLTPIAGGMGACCLGVDSCLADVTAVDCDAQGGTYHGNGSSCASCAPTGACCLTDGNCLTFLTEDECHAYAATWQGPDSSCAQANCPAGVPNDNCADALPIGLGDTVFSTLGASTDGPSLPQSCAESVGTFFGMDIWYVFEPAGNGTLTVSTCNQADYDTRLAAYTGTCGNLDIVGCNDDIVPPTCYYHTSIMEVPVSCGQPVLIRVGSYSVYTGTGTLTLSFEGSACDCNDNGVLDDEDIASGTSLDCDGNTVPDECEIPANDCNANGALDACDILDGISLDCDANGIPDECDVLTNDCNGNGVVDACDIADATSIDCNGNGLPDECEGDPICFNDFCDLPFVLCPGSVSGTTAGADSDGTANCGSSGSSPDVWYSYTPATDGTATFSTCGSPIDTVLSAHSGCPGTTANQIACNDDACGSFDSSISIDVVAGQTYLLRVSGYNGAAGGFTLTLDGPECAPVVGACQVAADCADPDGGGARTDGCMWWSCEAGACAGTAVVFADLGGPFGDCVPDGVADASDRFHALNCFADTDTFGTPGYPCEQAPPAAYNVDAGGPFGDCVPDGVCDGNDAFHAINAFDGSALCGCPLNSGGGGPAPAFEGGPVVRESVTLALLPEVERARAGDIVEVDVYFDQRLADVRGYQLHVGVSGGKRGRLELVDIAVDVRKDHVFASRPFWSAFNVGSAQLAAGLDGGGVSTPADGYLATLIFEVSADAAGTFVVDLLHDEHDSIQRTFLFPTPANGKVEIDGTTPAVIEVQPVQPARQR